jgi:hypothetical protein
VTYNIQRAIESFRQVDFIREAVIVHENPAILRIGRPGMQEVSVVLSDAYTFTEYDMEELRPHLSPGDFVALVDPDAGTTDNTKRLARLAGIEIGLVLDVSEALRSKFLDATREFDLLMSGSRNSSAKLR